MSTAELDIVNVEWTEEEDEKLRSSVILCKQKNWRIISENVGTKSPKQCQHRWKTQISPDILRVKGRWTREEDTKLIELVKKYGIKNWRFIASHLNGRLPKQCRERWCNQLDPAIKKDSLSQDEWKIVKDAHEKFGNRWSEIAKLLPGRTANHVKNQWNTMLRRQMFDVSINSDDESDYDITYSPGRKKRLSRSVDESFSHSSNSLKKRKRRDALDDGESSQDDSHSISDSNDTISIHSPTSSTVLKRNNPFPFFEALVEASCLILQKEQKKSSKQVEKSYGFKSVNMLPSFNHFTTSFTSHGKVNHGGLLYNF